MSGEFDIMCAIHKTNKLLERTNELLQMIYEQNTKVIQLEPTTEDIPDGLKEYLAARDAGNGEAG